MGSLNGTLLNSQPINHPDSGSRNWGNPIELTNGDIITLGTTSKVVVSELASVYDSLKKHEPLVLFSCYFICSFMALVVLVGNCIVVRSNITK